MSVRHARLIGVPDNPARPGHLGGDEWDADHVVSLVDADLPVTIARLADLGALYQPVDSDLTAIAALSTTAFGRGFLDLVDAAAGRTKLALGALATAASVTHASTTGQTANDHHAQVHGPTDHSDVTRKLFLPAGYAKLDGGTAANIGASPDLTGVIACADAATQGAFWTFMVPSDWASGTFTVQPVWAPGSTDGVAHTVRWSAQYKAIASGSDVTAAGTADGWTGNSATRTVGVVVYDGLSTTPAPATAGDLFRVLVRRVGADAGDSYVGVVNLLGVVLAYTANQ